MRQLIAMGAIVGFLVLNPTVVQSQLERSDFLPIKNNIGMCGYFYQIWSSLGKAGWLPELKSVEEDMLHRAAELGATTAQVAELKERFRSARDKAIKEGFVTKEDVDPIYEGELSESRERIHSTMEICFEFLNPAVVESQLERSDFLPIKNNIGMCGYFYQIWSSLGKAGWLPELQSVEEDMLIRAAELGASTAQVAELKKEYQSGRDDAIEEGFITKEDIKPVYEGEMSESRSRIRSTMDICFEFLK